MADVGERLGCGSENMSHVSYTREFKKQRFAKSEKPALFCYTIG